MKNRNRNSEVRRLLGLNPGLKAVRGGKHTKLLFNGRLVAILPYVQSKEGLSENTLCQLRRAGVDTGKAG